MIYGADRMCLNAIEGDNDYLGLDKKDMGDQDHSPHAYSNDNTYGRVNKLAEGRDHGPLSDKRLKSLKFTIQNGSCMPVTSSFKLQVTSSYKLQFTDKGKTERFHRTGPRTFY